MNTDNPTYLAVLMEHAAGALPPAYRVATDLHVALSAEGRAVSDVWMACGGWFLETMDLDDPGPHAPVAAPERAAMSAHDVLSHTTGTIAWKRSLFGFDRAETSLPGGQFLRLAPGRKVPAHGHDALELTVVLQGALSDGKTVYRRGDLLIGEPGVVHRPQSVGDIDCVCFAAVPARPAGVLGALLSHFH